VASIRVRQYGDAGDVRGILHGRNPDSFAKDATPLK